MSHERWNAPLKHTCHAGETNKYINKKTKQSRAKAFVDISTHIELTSEKNAIYEKRSYRLRRTSYTLPNKAQDESKSWGSFWANHEMRFLTAKKRRHGKPLQWLIVYTCLEKRGQIPEKGHEKAWIIQELNTRFVSLSPNTLRTQMC